MVSSYFEVSRCAAIKSSPETKLLFCMFLIIHLITCRTLSQAAVMTDRFEKVASQKRDGV